MNTDDLIRRLSRSVSPVSRHSMERRLAFGVVAGSSVAMFGFSTWLGIRADIGSAAATLPFLTKVSYTSYLAIGAIIACAHLMRPETRPNKYYLLLFAPVLATAALAAFELAASPRAIWISLFTGQSISACLIRILVISAPIFAGLIWAYRGFAPTRLRTAGGAIGLAAGAIAAAFYALFCVETSACFIFAWYSTAMLGMLLIGALSGPALLRW